MLKKIVKSLLNLFSNKIYIGKILKSRKCRKHILEVVKNLEKESYGRYKWEYRWLEKMNLTEPESLIREYILISEQKSDLSKRERDLIVGIVGMGIVKCIEKSKL